MRISTVGSRMSMIAWLSWGLGTYLVLETGPFIVIGLALKKTASELAGPYLACALPAAILMPLVWWLRQREEQGASPKRLARGWGVSVALFGAAMVVAVFYSGIKLRLMDPKDALVGFVVSLLSSAPIGYFTLYYMAIARFSSRAAAKGGGTRAN